MPDLDPEKFEDKYVHYLDELEVAYRNAFESMNEQYDSDLVHAIDQEILNESEPFYDDDGFRIELPENPSERVTGVVVPGERFDAVLDAYVEELRRELARVFDRDP